MSIKNKQKDEYQGWKEIIPIFFKSIGFTIILIIIFVVFLSFFFYFFYPDKFAD